MKRSRIIATAATAGLLTLGATSAAAHVTVDANTTEGGSYAILSFSVPHGCGDSSTTGISIQVPEQFSSVTPTVHHSWDVEMVTETLDPPADDGHGGELTERVTEVVYEADTPLPSDQREVFELSVQLPDTPGEEIAFPVVQTCEEGEAAWVQLAADGQDAGELAEPAPTVTVTAADSGDGGAGEPDTADAEPAAGTEPAAGGEAQDTDPASGDAASEPAATDSTTGAPAAVAWIALALGAGGLVLGGLGFARSRRKA